MTVLKCNNAPEYFSDQRLSLAPDSAQNYNRTGIEIQNIPSFPSSRAPTRDLTFNGSAAHQVLLYLQTQHIITIIL